MNPSRTGTGAPEPGRQSTSHGTSPSASETTDTRPNQSQRMPRFVARRGSWCNRDLTTLARPLMLSCEMPAGLALFSRPWFQRGFLCSTGVIVQTVSLHNGGANSHADPVRYGP